MRITSKSGALLDTYDTTEQAAADKQQQRELLEAGQRKWSPRSPKCGSPWCF
jgi:hypothetical protein